MEEEMRLVSIECHTIYDFSNSEFLFHSDYALGLIVHWIVCNAAQVLLSLEIISNYKL